MQAVEEKLGYGLGNMIKAIVETATGRVDNVIEIEPDDEGGFSHWTCPDGYQMVDAGHLAQPGGTWDGSNFIAPVIPTPPRLDVLMAQGPAIQIYNEATEVMDDRPAEDLAADKAELLELLQSKLAASENLTWEEMNKMLALERES